MPGVVKAALGREARDPTLARNLHEEGPRPTFPQDKGHFPWWAILGSNQ